MRKINEMNETKKTIDRIEKEGMKEKVMKQEIKRDWWILWKDEMEEKNKRWKKKGWDEKEIQIKMNAEEMKMRQQREKRWYENRWHEKEEIE